MCLIRGKGLLEPIVQQTKADEFLLFLKAFSCETDLWVTLGYFMFEGMNGNLYATESWSGVNEICWTEDNYNYIKTYVQKDS